MNKNIYELIVGSVMIVLGIMNIFWGRKCFSFLYKRKIIDLLPGDSLDTNHWRSLIGSVLFIGLGIFLIIKSFR
ncbi:hypothetical protein JCM18694_32550 [Prolixibacter denitrificans]|uniref:Immunity protein 17 of polymorphic toxin system n=1 Tax=Prolixibacter denitrificans TaxID=1541063 RepID=A0ABQ0ZQC8_9BACT|nr:hypothetical protein JCM18694_32550 [Prolixibacter denitrificans]